MKGKVRKLTIIVLVSGALLFSPILFRAFANPDPIDVGPGATNRAGSLGGTFTRLCIGNPANLSGTLDTVEIWAASNISGAKVGTFYLDSGTTYVCRDGVSIGAVTAGSKQTFSGLSLSVEAGDYIGLYFTSGGIEYDSSGGTGWYYISGDYCDPLDSGIYTLNAAPELSLYATGESAAPPAGGSSQVITIVMD